MENNQQQIEELVKKIQELQEENKQLKNSKKFGLVFEEKKEYLILPLKNGNYLFNDKIYKYIKDVDEKKEKKKYTLIDKELGIYEKNNKEYIIKEGKLLEFVDFCKKTYKPILAPKNNKNFDIITNPSKPMNYLIEGDNYHSLQLLKTTHYGKIDVIYIDPPYNTGEKDFKYNDNFIEKDDGYRHSKWLNFMKKRLEVSYELLKKQGIICISIDFNEISRLRLLCDDIFGDTNCLGQISVINNLKGRSDDNYFATCNEFLLVYSKNIKECFINKIKIEEEEIDNEYQFQDNKSFYKLTGFRKTGKGWERKERPYMFYPILKKNNEIFSIKEEEFSKIYNSKDKTFNDVYINELVNNYKRQGFETYLPLNNKGEYGRWRWGFHDKFKTHHKTELETNSNNTLSVKMRSTLENGEIRGKLSKTVWYKAEYDTGSAGNRLKYIFNRNNDLFDNPKSTYFIQDLLHIISNKNSTVLDFFAGSGTTGQAVQQLNKEDGGNRQYIMMTNNENNICEDITYERIARIINPEKYKLDVKKVIPLPHNLTYLKTEGIDINDDNVVENIIEMIKLKEGVFLDIEDQNKTFENKNKRVSIYFCDDDIQRVNKSISKSKNNIIYLEIEKEDIDRYIELNNLPKDVEYEPIPEELQKALKLLRN